MRNWYALIALTTVACGGQGIQPTSNGEDIPGMFPFDGIRVSEFLSEDPLIGYKLVGTMSDVVQETPDGRVYTINTVVDCVASDCGQPDGVTVRSVQWRSSISDGVFIHGYGNAQGTLTQFDPPVQLGEREMNSGDSVETITGGFTFTATFEGYDECPVRWQVDWGRTCGKFTLDDGDGIDETNAEIVGTYWAIVQYNVVATQLVGDTSIWELSSWDCTDCDGNW